jgi:hypothetical protein
MNSLEVKRQMVDTVKEMHQAGATQEMIETVVRVFLRMPAMAVRREHDDCQFCGADFDSLDRDAEEKRSYGT